MRILLALLLWPLSCTAEDVSFDWDWTLSAATAQSTDSPFFSPTDAERQTLDALLDVQTHWQGMTGRLALRATNVLSSDEEAHDGEVIIQEWFWHHSFSSVDATAGKLRLDWGVGYGYRPLDIFKPYRRHPVGIQVEEGAGTLLLSHFDALGDWSVVATDSSWTQQEGSELEQAAQQKGIGIRRYLLQGDTEWQGIAYYDDVRRGLLAMSVISVLDPAWEWHGSLLYQNRYLSYVTDSSAFAPELKTQSSGYQGLLGLNWASLSGHNIIAEYWYDSRAWSQSEWQNVRQSALQWQNSPLAQSLAAGYSHANLVQHNFMLHWTMAATAWREWSWSRTQSWLDDFTPTTDVLIAPQDGGVIATQWFNYLAWDSGATSVEVEVAARFYTGRSESAYANLPDKHMILLNLKGKF